MRAVSVELRGFRNLEPVTAAIGPSVTVVHGENGAGKTNLIEGLYFGLTGRSFRTRNERDLISWGEPVARAAVTVEADSGRREIAAAIERSGSKKLSIDGTVREAGASLDDRPAVAIFSPDRLDLVKGEPRLRRAHLDQFAAAWRPARSDLRRRYSAALAQRNALLVRVRSGHGGSGTLDAWDRELAEEAVALVALRAAAIDALDPHFALAAEELGLPGRCGIRYAPSFTGAADELAARLAEARESDQQRGFTGLGPHRDEIHLESDGRVLRRFGSQGQQRMGVLALLLAEREELTLSATPILLLDDVLSELDAGRRERLMERLQTAGQAVITTADAEHVPNVDDHSALAVAHGVINVGTAA